LANYCRAAPKVMNSEEIADDIIEFVEKMKAKYGSE
jgi:hypothetical protein